MSNPEPVKRIEELAERVHEAYLTTCAKPGWPVKPENQIPYAELSEDSKELDRASVRAVLAGISYDPERDDEQYFTHMDDLIRAVVVPMVVHHGGEEDLFDGSGCESGDEREVLAAAISQCMGYLDERLDEQAKTIERLRELLQISRDIITGDAEHLGGDDNYHYDMATVAKIDAALEDK